MDIFERFIKERYGPKRRPPEHRADPEPRALPTCVICGCRHGPRCPRARELMPKGK